MKDYIEERAVEIANYIIDTKATVRQAAKKFGISKSTVHKDCTDRLSQLNPGLAYKRRARYQREIFTSALTKMAAVGYDSSFFDTFSV